METKNKENNTRLIQYAYHVFILKTIAIHSKTVGIHKHQKGHAFIQLAYFHRCSKIA